jgi:hypothetical protein
MATIQPLQTALDNPSRLSGLPDYKAISNDRSVVVSQFQKLLDNFTNADMDQLMETLSSLHAMTSTLQGEVSAQRLRASDSERKDAAKKMMEMLHAVAAKLEEAMEAAKGDKVLGWVSAIAEMTGAVLLTSFAIYSAVASGGASVPLVSLSLSMLTTSTMAVANMGAKETGLQATSATGETKQANISFDGMVEAIVDQQIADGTIVVIRQKDGLYLDAKGGVIEDPRKNAKPGAIFLSSEQLTKWKMAWGITANVVIAAMMMSMGYGAADFAAQGANFGSKIATSSQAVKLARLEQAGSVAQLVGEVFGSVQGMYEGATSLKLAEIDKDTEEARAYKAFYETMVRELTQRLSLIMESLRQVYTSVNENYKSVSDCLKASADTSANISHGMA